MFKKLRNWNFSRKDAHNRENIIQEAFKDNRWVMFIKVRYHQKYICFTPTLDEAHLFLTNYVVPFIIGNIGAFEHGSWKKNYYRSEFIRFQDIEWIEIETATEEERRYLTNRAMELAQSRLNPKL